MSFAGDAGRLYGVEFEASSRAQPIYAFLEEGSQVAVYPGNRRAL
jgi:hypothetical protein